MFASYLLYSAPVSLQFFVSGLVHINVSRCTESRKRDNNSSNFKLRVTSWSRVYVA